MRMEIAASYKTEEKLKAQSEELRDAYGYQEKESADRQLRRPRELSSLKTWLERHLNTKRCALSGALAARNLPCMFFSIIVLAR